jgi:hypothetical protein
MPKSIPKAKDVIVGGAIAGIGFIGALLVLRYFGNQPILEDARAELRGS